MVNYSAIEKHMEDKDNKELKAFTNIILETAVEKDSKEENKTATTAATAAYNACLKESELDKATVDKVRNHDNKFIAATTAACGILAATSMKDNKAIESHSLVAATGGGNKVTATVHRTQEVSGFGSESTTKVGGTRVNIKTNHKSNAYKAVTAANEALIKSVL